MNTEGGPQFERVYAQVHPSGFGARSTSYHALTDNYGAAEVLLQHPYSEPDRNATVGDGSDYVEGLNQWISNRRRQNVDPADRQTVMFDHQPGRVRPPMITSLSATSGAKHLIPRVMGTAIHQSLAQFGRVPEASTDLSKFSAPFVSKLTGQQFERKNDEDERYADVAAAELHAEHQMAGRRVEVEGDLNAWRHNPQPVDMPVQEAGARLFRNHVKYMARMRKQAIETSHTQPELPFST